jgi:hypothetical protein
MKFCASRSKQEGVELEVFLLGDPAVGVHEGH